MKPEAIRPVAWIARQNPILAARSTLGDVAASIMAEWPDGAEVNGREWRFHAESARARLATNSGSSAPWSWRGEWRWEGHPGRRGMDCGDSH